MTDTEDLERAALLAELFGDAGAVALPGDPETGDSPLASRCRATFKDFVQVFWSEVPGASGQELVWNWHLDLMCEQLQEVAEDVFAGRVRKHDTVINISPGTTKSTVCSILFNAWVWTRMPHARVLTASHTDSLVLDLANKTRAVVKSELYGELFPEIELRSDQDTKSYFANTHGGDRYTCTVGGKSPMGFHAHFIVVDDPIDPKKAVSDVELDAARDFISNIIPTRKVDKRVTVTFLIMQRLHHRDPTAVMLDNAKKAGAVKVRHVCLPAELFPNSDGGFEAGNVKPQHLAQRYVNGLMDPVRLGKETLDEYKASLGPYGYAGQFLQSPIPPGGGMFKPHYFAQREKAAPYDCKRVRYWDRAATQDGGAYTAGVLQARTLDRHKHYVEHCVHGQWEPDERDRVIVATARRDRLKYGPAHEPTIVIEQEPGSAGVEAYRNIARRLAALGFSVKADRPTGKKDTRAEPWSCMCAAMGVVLVEDGTWDLEGYVQEHLMFRPEEGKRLGKYKDQVDASSGGFNYLTSKNVVQGKVYAFKKKQQRGPFFLALCQEDVAGIEMDPNLNTVVLWAEDGPNVEVPDLPFKPLAVCTLGFWDVEPAELQKVWEEEVAPGRKPEDVVMTRDHGRKAWAAMLRRYDQPVTVYVFYSPGGGRALSMALAACDAMGRPRSAVFRPSQSDTNLEGFTPPSKHAYDVMRAARASVVS